jgi:signal transduction histidine kinase
MRERSQASEAGTPANHRRRLRATGRTILVVDDQAETRRSLRMLLEREGHRVLTAEHGAAALELLAREPVQVMLVDHSMPMTDGQGLIGRVRERDSLVQIVLQTCRAGGSPAREMLARLAVQGYHDKNDPPERLLLAVDAALKVYDQLAQLHIAERLKTELLANVSHEFRTPLNVILGYLDLVREGTFGPCPPGALAVFEKVVANAAYLLELVEEFLDLSKLEAGSLAVRRDAVVLGPLLRELGEAFAFLVRDRPLAFTLDIPDDLPAVAADEAKLRVVIQNLLANAAKFTVQGEIRLAARSTADGNVTIHVRDTGPGIAPEHHEAIFELFHQLNPGDSQGKGVGLGLALARRFARVMDGDVTVESTLGGGATFTVTLRIFTAAPPSPPPTTTAR